LAAEVGPHRSENELKAWVFTKNGSWDHRLTSLKAMFLITSFASSAVSVEDWAGSKESATGFPSQQSPQQKLTDFLASFLRSSFVTNSDKIFTHCQNV
jgi:hypothetical protein